MGCILERGTGPLQAQQGLADRAAHGHSQSMQLPLWAFSLVSAAAILALAALVWRLRPGAAAPMTPDGALALFRREFPDTACNSADMAPDGRAALILGPSGNAVGIVCLVGLFWTARQAGGADIARIDVSSNRLSLIFADFTWPSLAVTLRDAAQAQGWAARFSAQNGQTHA
jgi:hypothetical protein